MATIDLTPDTTEIRIKRYTTLEMLVDLTDDVDGPPDVATDGDTVTWYLKSRDGSYSAAIAGTVELLGNDDGNRVRFVLPANQWTFTESWRHEITMDWAIKRWDAEQSEQFTHAEGTLVLEASPGDLMEAP